MVGIMSKTDMVNRTSHIGFSVKVDECAPDDVEHPVSMIFDDNTDEVTIRIVETKRGGRTYTAKAKIEKSDLKRIMEAVL